jgi:LacI family transcriptional regulator
MAGGLGSRAGRKAITRADVARYAGVSSAVVSYVVNGGPKPVAPATAARVREAISILGYRPNVNARALKVGTTGMLGLVVPDSSNPFFAEFGLEIERAATERGLALLIANSNSDADLEARLIIDLVGRQVDGLIVSGAAGPPRSRAPGEGRLGTPTVYIDSPLPARGFDTIGSDSQEGARQAVDHLLDVHRHETVALLIGSGVRTSVDERETGWQRALRDAGRTDGSVVRAPFTREGGYRGGLRLLEGRPRPSAVFASNALQAVGLLRAAHELGVRVPEELAMVAFDGTQECEFCWPPLTSARQRIQEMADAAVRTVLDRADSPPTHQLFPVDLVVRRSCGCADYPPASSTRKRRSRS